VSSNMIVTSNRETYLVMHGCATGIKSASSVSAILVSKKMVRMNLQPSLGHRKRKPLAFEVCRLSNFPMITALPTQSLRLPCIGKAMERLICIA
jgi:hypothetical protein